MISRVLESGYCQYKDLKDGSLDLDDFYNMHDMLDLQQYLRIQAENRQEP